MKQIAERIPLLVLILTIAGCSNLKEQAKQVDVASNNVAPQVDEKIASDDTTGLSPLASELSEYLDSFDVEHHWLRSHLYIKWATGDPMTKHDGELLPPIGADETHCSSFVAAACAELKIYLLHPPEHSHVLLANAQFDWLASPAGQQAGWSFISDARAAQHAANQGQIVVAVFKSADPKRAGHIAVIRPSLKSDEQIDREGPQIVQAGFFNKNSTNLAFGFERHPGAWVPTGVNGVRFFQHAVDENILKQVLAERVDQ